MDNRIYFDRYIIVVIVTLVIWYFMKRSKVTPWEDYNKIWTIAIVGMLVSNTAWLLWKLIS